MKLGVMIRNMGPASTPDVVAAAARAADANPSVSDVWVVDHIAIPPDDAEGSGGRYLDPLASLAYLAGVTTRVGLGVAVLVLPYRPALPTAKWVATIQELSGGRLLLGVGGTGRGDDDVAGRGGPHVPDHHAELHGSSVGWRHTRVKPTSCRDSSRMPGPRWLRPLVRAVSAAAGRPPATSAASSAHSSFTRSASLSLLTVVSVGAQGENKIEGGVT